MGVVAPLPAAPRRPRPPRPARSGGRGRLNPRTALLVWLRPCPGFPHHPSATRAPSRGAARAHSEGEIVCHCPCSGDGRSSSEEQQAPPAAAAPESKPPEAPTDGGAGGRARPPTDNPPARSAVAARAAGKAGGRRRRDDATRRRRRRDAAAGRGGEEARRAQAARASVRRAAPSSGGRRCRRRSASCSSRSTPARSASPCSRTTCVAEVYLERPEHRSIAGNIYLGTVDNVLPGMEAAFVEIGLEKNGFLYVDEIVGPELEGRKGARKIQDLIQQGQTILVQAVKDPMKTKGARLTTEISLPGRFVVFVPYGDGLGVSRRLEEDERNRLKAIVKELAPKHGRRDRPHRRRGRVRRGRRARPRLPAAPLEDDRGAREDGEGADAHLPGGRAAAARHARPLHRRLREAARRPRPRAQADRRLPEEDLAAHGRAGRALPGPAAADGGVRGRAGDPAPRSAGASTCPPAAT